MTGKGGAKGHERTQTGAICLSNALSYIYRRLLSNQLPGRCRCVAATVACTSRQGSSRRRSAACRGSTAPCWRSWRTAPYRSRTSRYVQRLAQGPEKNGARWHITHATHPGSHEARPRYDICEMMRFGTLTLSRCAPHSGASRPGARAGWTRCRRRHLQVLRPAGHGGGVPGAGAAGFVHRRRRKGRRGGGRQEGMRRGEGEEATLAGGRAGVLVTSQAALALEQSRV